MHKDLDKTISSVKSLILRTKMVFNLDCKKSYKNATKPNRCFEAKGYRNYAKPGKFGIKEAKLATLALSPLETLIYKK